MLEGYEGVESAESVQTWRTLPGIRVPGSFRGSTIKPVWCASGHRTRPQNDDDRKCNFTWPKKKVPKL